MFRFQFRHILTGKTKSFFSFIISGGVELEFSSDMICTIRSQLDRGAIRSSLRDGSSIPYRLSSGVVWDCSTMTLSTWETYICIFGPSCTEFVYSGCWHFDNGATSKFDDVLLELGELPHVLPLTVHLKFFC